MYDARREQGQEQDEQQAGEVIQDDPQVIYCEGSFCGQAITEGDVTWIDDKALCDDCVAYREDQELLEGLAVAIRRNNKLEGF